MRIVEGDNFMQQTSRNTWLLETSYYITRVDEISLITCSLLFLFLLIVLELVNIGIFYNVFSKQNCQRFHHQYHLEI